MRAVRAGTSCGQPRRPCAGWQIAEAEFTARSGGYTPFIFAQSPYLLLDRRLERKVIPVVEAYGIGVLPYFPLANGLLTGKYRRNDVPRGSRLTHARQNLLETTDWDQLEAYSAFANERGVSEVQVAFSWLTVQPSVGSVIAGATTPQQVQQNAAATDRTPTVQDLEELDRIFPPPSA